MEMGLKIQGYNCSALSSSENFFAHLLCFFSIIFPIISTLSRAQVAMADSSSSARTSGLRLIRSAVEVSLFSFPFSSIQPSWESTHQSPSIPSPILALICSTVGHFFPLFGLLLLSEAAAPTCSGLRASSPPRQVSNAEASFSPNGDPAVHARSTSIGEKKRPGPLNPSPEPLSEDDDSEEAARAAARRQEAKIFTIILSHSFTSVCVC